MHLSFGSPMIWTDPIDHQRNCYICLTNVFGYSGRNRDAIQYANIDSVTRPVPHSDTLPVPVTPQANPNAAQVLISDDDVDESDDDVDESDDDDIADPLYLPDTNQPHKLSQGDFYDLVRDLNLSKNMSELLGSSLQQWNLLDTGRFLIYFLYVYI